MLPDALHGDLADWLPRLGRTIGPLKRSRSTPDGPPDGFAGLSRRGPYERLLMTEWLLAKELPEEFIRRAVTHEHLFLQLARREPAGGLRSVVLFDGGPSQIGEPRLAHLAALVIFAQRAADAGAELIFGVLQAVPPPMTVVSPENAERIMHARAAEAPTESQYSAWLDAAANGGGSPQPLDDVWLVGGPQTREWAARAAFGHVEPQDVLALDRRAISVTVRQGAAPRSVELPLPSIASCIRLLRDPYRPPARPRTRPRASGMIFSHDGRYLMMRTIAGVAAMRVSRSADEEGGTVRHLAFPEGDIIAADAFKKRFLVLAAIDGMLILQVFRHRGQVDQVTDLGHAVSFIRPGADQSLAPLLPMTIKGSLPRRMLTFDASGTSHVVDTIKDRSVQPTDFEAIAAVRHRSAIEFLAKPDDGRDDALRLGYERDGKFNTIRRYDAFPPATAFFGAARRDRFIAVRAGFDTWQFPNFGHAVVAEGTPVGAAEHLFPDGQRRPAVIVLSDDRRKVLLFAPNDQHLTYPLKFTAQEAVASATHPLVAVRAKDGSIDVVHLDEHGAQS